MERRHGNSGGNTLNGKRKISALENHISFGDANDMTAESTTNQGVKKPAGLRRKADGKPNRHGPGRKGGEFLFKDLWKECEQSDFI